MKPTILLVPCCLLSLALSGCSQSDADDHANDHHLEHFVPHHKPANFDAAVRQIDERTEHLSLHAGHRHGDEGEELQELLDVVNWIPELAADSDLNESEWNQANAAKKTMAKKLESRRSANGELDLKDLDDAITSELQILTSLVDAAGPPEPALHHDHHHHHGDHDHHDHDHDDHDHDHDDDHDDDDHEHDEEPAAQD